jgi:hypothetical protein
VGQHPYQTNFTAGELTKGLWSRTDYRKYPNGIEFGINAVVEVQGGVSRRAGTQFIAQTRGRSAFQASAFQNNAFQVTPSRSVMLKEFIFNTTEAYMLEFGPFYIRFYRNREQLLGTGDGTELATNGEFTSDLSGWDLQQDNGGTVVHSAPGIATLDPGAAGVAGISQQISGLSPGEKYVLHFEIGGQQLDFNVGSSLGAANVITEQTLLSGEYRVTFTAPGAGSVFIEWKVSGPGAVASLDDVSLQFAAPLEVTTPYEPEDIRSLRFTQSLDQLWIAHDDYPEKILTRLSDVLWTFQDSILVPPPSEEVDIEPPAKLTPGDVVGQNVQFDADASVFLAADVGRQIKSRGGSASIIVVDSGTQVHADITAAFISTDQIPAGLWSMDGSPNSILTFSAAGPANVIVDLTLTTAGWRSTDVGAFVHALDGIFEITEINSATAARAQVIRSIPDTVLVAQAGAWTLERESFSEALGFAAVPNFYEQRRWLAKGQEIFGSRVGDFQNFGLGPNDDDSVRFPLVNGSNQADITRWMKSMKDMLLGTIGTEYRVNGGSESTITPTQILNKPQSNWGSDPEPDAIRAGKAVMFTQRGRRQIREMGFDIADDGFAAADITVLAEHLFRSGVVQLAYCSSPSSYVLAVLEDGRIACCTYYREEEVIAWTQFRPSGWEIGKGKFTSVAVMPSKCGNGDEVWCIAEREIGTRTGLYVEVFDGQLNTECALVYDDTIPVDTVVGLTHLDGAVVDILHTSRSAFQRSAFQMSAFQKVRATYATATVAAGTVTLAANEAVRIEVGLHYNTKIKTLPLEAPSREGTIHFRKKRSPTVYVRFLCTKGTGVYVNNQLVPRRGLELTELYDFQRETSLGWNRLEQVTIEQRHPFPMTVLGVSRNLIYDDGENP